MPAIRKPRMTQAAHSAPFRLALLADPHYHAVDADFGFDGIEWRGVRRAAVRTLEDSGASTRIYNESFFALPSALDQVVAEGIRHVVIAGDLTDDGQAATMAAASALLSDYEARHGLRFYLTPGNHDFFGMHGRDHTKRFLAAGGAAVSVGSGAEADIQSAAMACEGYPAALRKWSRFGLGPREDDLLWETPFGRSGAASDRVFEMRSPDGAIRHRQIDASYLVEPDDGLWILSLDANVFAPRDGRPDQRAPDAVSDSTDAGWNAMVEHKDFVLDWIADIVRRAKAGGKALLTFSHYPMIDPLRGTLREERELFGDTSMGRRTPMPHVAERLVGTGLSHHFSGHLHVEAVSRVRSGDHDLTNFALPSLVAFPGGWKSVALSIHEMTFAHREVEPKDFGAFFDLYRASDPAAPILGAQSYGAFLSEHVREMAVRRYLPQEWPQDLVAAFASSTVRDLVQNRSGLPSELLDSSFVDLVADFYRFRNGHRAAVERMPAERLAGYHRLAERLADGGAASGEHRDRLVLFGRMLRAYLHGEEAG